MGSKISGRIEFDVELLRKDGKKRFAGLSFPVHGEDEIYYYEDDLASSELYELAFPQCMSYENALRLLGEIRRSKPGRFGAHKSAPYSDVYVVKVKIIEGENCTSFTTERMPHASMFMLKLETELTENKDDESRYLCYPQSRW